MDHTDNISSRSGVVAMVNYTNDIGMSNDINAYKKMFNNINTYKKISNLFLGIAIMLVNLFAAASYIALNRRRKKIVNYLLLNQAVIDFGIGVTTFLLVLPAYQEKLIFHTLYNISVSACFDFTVFLAFGSLIFTSVERLIAIKAPLYHRSFVTRQKIFIGIILLWALASIPSFVYVLNAHSSICGHTKKYLLTYRTVSYSIILVGALLVLTILFVTLRTLKMAMREQIVLSNKDTITIASNKNERQNEVLLVHQKKESKLIKIFLFMAIVYTVTFLPTAIINLVIKNLEFIAQIVADMVTQQLYVLSALFNPIFTLIRKDDVRREILRLFRRKPVTAPSRTATNRITYFTAL